MTLIQQAMIPLEPKLSVPVYAFPPTRVNTRMVQLVGATTHDMTCGLSLRLSELSPGDCCFQLMKELYNSKSFSSASLTARFLRVFLLEEPLRVPASMDISQLRCRANSTEAPMFRRTDNERGKEVSS